MSRIKKLQVIRTMKFEEIYDLRRKKQLSAEDAASLLGVDVRTFRRWKDRYEAEGAEGLYDRRLGRIAGNAAPTDEVMKLLTLFKTYYREFNTSHFYDKYRYEHSGKRCYTWVKNQLQKNNLVLKKRKRKIPRIKRERAPLKGMMLHQDGSTHQWIQDVYWDLIVTMDDADSELYSAFFVQEEGTWSSMRGVREVIEQYGLFCSLYTDRGSHYWNTPKVGGRVDKHNLTQFGRAMKQLDIQMIAAYSPEARGRSERMFGTLQGRLPNELKLAGITDMEKANQFLKEKFLPAHNKCFKTTLEADKTAFIPFKKGNIDLNNIFCIQNNREVKKDNTIQYNGKIYQIPADKHRWNYAKTRVKIHEYMDETISIFHGPRFLARYDKNGNLIE